MNINRGRPTLWILGASTLLIATTTIWTQRQNLFGQPTPPAPDRRLLEQVRDLNQMARFSEAIALLREEIRANPDMRHLHLNLGATYANTLDFDRAIEHFGKELELDPASATVREHMARAYEHSGRPQEAARYYREWVELDSLNWQAHRRLADVLLQLGNSTQALDSFARSAEIATSEPAPWLGMGTVLMDAGDLERARRCFERALQLAPNDPQAAYNLGQALMALGAAEEAEQALARFRELSEQENELAFLLRSRARANSTPESSWEYGEALRKRGDLSLALPEFRAAVAKDPTFVPGYVSTAIVEMDLGDYPGAQAALEAAAPYGVESFDYHFQRARVLGHLSRPDDAVASLRRAQRLRPLRREEAHVIAETLARGGAVPAAEWVLEEMLTSDPGDHATLALLGVVAHMHGDLPSAEERYRRALELAPAQARYAFFIDMVRASRGDSVSTDALSRIPAEEAAVLLTYFHDLPGAQSLRHQLQTESPQ